MRFRKSSQLKVNTLRSPEFLHFINGQDALDQIEACGGYSQNNVTQNTDYLVVGYYRPNSIHGEKSNKTRLAENTFVKARRSQSSGRTNSSECCGRHRKTG